MNRREVLGGASAAWLAMGLDGVRGLAEQAKADELRVGMIGPEAADRNYYGNCCMYREFASRRCAISTSRAFSR